VSPGLESRPEKRRNFGLGAAVGLARWPGASEQLAARPIDKLLDRVNVLTAAGSSRLWGKPSAYFVGEHPIPGLPITSPRGEVSAGEFKIRDGAALPLALLGRSGPRMGGDRRAAEGNWFQGGTPVKSVIGAASQGARGHP